MKRADIKLLWRAVGSFFSRASRCRQNNNRNLIRDGCQSQLFNFILTLKPRPTREKRSAFFEYKFANKTDTKDARHLWIFKICNCRNRTPLLSSANHHAVDFFPSISSFHSNKKFYDSCALCCRWRAAWCAPPCIGVGQLQSMIISKRNHKTFRALHQI